jgi:hypothetical protein
MLVELKKKLNQKYRYQMILNIHENNQSTIITLCDSELVGKTFEEGKKILDLSSDYYKGQEYTDTSVIADTLRNADIIMAVGQKAIDLLKREELLTTDETKTIQEIPYTQVVIE